MFGFNKIILILSDSSIFPKKRRIARIMLFINLYRLVCAVAVYKFVYTRWRGYKQVELFARFLFTHPVKRWPVTG